MQIDEAVCQSGAYARSIQQTAWSSWFSEVALLYKFNIFCWQIDRHRTCSRTLTVLGPNNNNLSVISATIDDNSLTSTDGLTVSDVIGMVSTNVAPASEASIDPPVPDRGRLPPIKNTGVRIPPPKKNDNRRQKVPKCTYFHVKFSTFRSHTGVGAPLPDPFSFTGYIRDKKLFIFEVKLFYYRLLWQKQHTTACTFAFSGEEQVPPLARARGRPYITLTAETYLQKWPTQKQQKMYMDQGL